MSKKIVELNKHEFAESFLHLNGRPLSLDDYPHMRAVYNCSDAKVVLKFSRQTAKSTTLANIMVTNSVLNPYFKSLYISPSVDQTKVFSHDRVNPVMETSPFIKKHYINSTIIQNVFMKQLLNGSRMYLRYAHLSADRVRGYSADMCLFDEVQDQLEDNIPVIEETMSRSLYKMSWFSGTPKLTAGPLEDRWEMSSKNEWMPKCEHCNTWQVLDEDNIGPHQLICKKCGKDLHSKNGQWVSTGKKDATFTGFRVCLLHFHAAPWVDWERDVIQKQKTQSKNIFYNETLALPYDIGAAPITRTELFNCCTDTPMLETLPSKMRDEIIMLGVDYGPVNSDKSYTCVSIVRYVNGKYEVLYGKRYVGKEAEFSFIHDDILDLYKTWKCTHVCADYGMGEASNSVIRKALGYEKVISFQHLPAQKEIIKWNPKIPAYTLNRTNVMSNIFHKCKSQAVIFPKRSDRMDDLLQDFLNIQMDYNVETNVMKYVNPAPDDFFHATLFAIIGLDMFHHLASFRAL